MAPRSRGCLLLLAIATVTLVSAQQQCYYAAGADFRAPADVVPCDGSGQSACCKLGDTCLSGNVCFNFETGDTYQYGCTDVTYQDATCPFKCGFNATLSPWTALEYCTDIPDVTDTWACHAPESCGCAWQSTYDLLVLAPRGCKEMGNEARVGLYAPPVLVPYASLPSTAGGSTGYFQGTTTDGTSTWSVVNGYTPDSTGPSTTYPTPAQKVIALLPNADASPATLQAAHLLSSSAPISQNTHITYVAPTSTSSTKATTTTNAARIVTKTAKGTIKTVTESNSPKTSSLANAGSRADSTTSSSLSSNAKIGLGVGIALGLALLAGAIAAIFYLRKRRNRSALPTSDPDSDENGHEKFTAWSAANYPKTDSSYYDPHHSVGSYDQRSSYNPHSSGWSPPPDVVHEASYSKLEEQTVRDSMKARAVELEGQSGAHEMAGPHGTESPQEMESPPLGSSTGGLGRTGGIRGFR